MEKAAQRSLIYFFQFVCLQNRKHEWWETPVLDVNIAAMCNKGMQMVSGELSKLITGVVILSPWIRGKISS